MDVVAKRISFTNHLENALTGLVPSKRSATQLLSNNGFGLGWFGGATTKTGTPVNDKTALRLSAVFNGVNLISNDLAKISLGVYKKTAQGREALSDHPINFILTKEPNKFMSAFTFRKLAEVIAILKGNFYAQIVRNKVNGNIEQLHIWDWSKVQQFKTESSLFYKYNGKMYSSDDVLHIMGFSLDGLTGIGIISLAAHSLGVSLSAQEYAQEYYDSKGVGSGIITTDAGVDLNKTGKRAVSKAVTDVLTTISPWRIPVLDEGMKFTQLKITAEEAQFINTHKHGVEEVARWLNIQLHKLKNLDKATNNNIEHQSIEYVQDSIHPLAVQREQEYQRKLLSSAEKKDHYIKYNLRSLLRADLKSQAEYYSKAIQGWLSPNEIRELEEMNKAEGGEYLLRPVNLARAVDNYIGSGGSNADDTKNKEDGEK